MPIDRVSADDETRDIVLAQLDRRQKRLRGFGSSHSRRGAGQHGCASRECRGFPKELSASCFWHNVPYEDRLACQARFPPSGQNCKVFSGSTGGANDFMRWESFSATNASEAKQSSPTSN